jgi:hypothetical protein
MFWLVVLGLVAFSATWALTLPASRSLVIKLGTLVDMARRANPELFRTQLEQANPFVGAKFRHGRVTAMLRADMSQFGEICQRLQREAKQLDRRAHLGMLPAGAYLVGLGLWFVLG